jgi:Na+-driven multidrug efflux pump
MFLEFSITTVDFLFLERVSYLATIGVSSLMAYIYMSQYIITLFSQSMINNAIYHIPNRGEDFNKLISIGFFYCLFLAIMVSLVFYFSKEFLISFFKISQEAKQFAFDYLSFMIPFLIVFSVSQYVVYVVYALKLAKFNIFYFFAIIILNIIFNFIAYKLSLGVKGIALASGLAVVFVIPWALWNLKKHAIVFVFTRVKIYYQISLIGVKKLGIAGVLDPLAHHFMLFFTSIMVSKIGGEMLSAKYHSHNFLLFASTLALSFGVVLQFSIAKKYGQKQIHDIRNFYYKYLKVVFFTTLILVSLANLVIYLGINFVSANDMVKKYIILAMLMGIIAEPFRALGIVAKASLRGLQQANLPLFIRVFFKDPILIGVYFIFYHYGFLSLQSVILISGVGFLFNFIIYHYFILKKL